VEFPSSTGEISTFPNPFLVTLWLIDYTEMYHLKNLLNFPDVFLLLISNPVPILYMALILSNVFGLTLCPDSNLS
jgi:hypothetical protein